MGIKIRKQDVVPKSDFQRIWAMAKCNGADYREPPRTPIEWPKSTWLEQRLEYLREKAKRRC